MKPDPAAPADPLNLLRQQLILAQVRIMELEDVRDELAPQIANLEKLLAGAQTLADRKTDEAAHLERVRTSLQAEYEHLRHMQHVTNEALNAARAEAGGLASREKALLSEVENLHLLTRQLAESERQHLTRLAALEKDVAAALAESATRQERINQLDAEQRAMKASRSWRWTSWLRSLERTFGGKP
jgi:chromosome segregation ATPase